MDDMGTMGVWVVCVWGGGGCCCGCMDGVDLWFLWGGCVGGTGCVCVCLWVV